MPAEIILQARKENEVVIEGEVHLVINEDTPSDIVIEVPNQNGRLLSKEMLSNNTLVSSDTIKRPIILVPENNSIGFTGTFVLSPYEPSETYSGVPTGMRIEISSTEDFSMIMKNVVIDELLSEVPVTFEESSEVLYARVKYVSDSHVSGYSDVVKFTNSDFYVYQPKILTPTVNATGVARTPFIQVSDYQYMGNENYYAGLTYEVATDSNFTNVVETDTVGSPNTGESGSSNGVYLNNFIVNTILDEDTIYYVRVKYLGTVYPSSIWSDTISFRTFNVEERIVSFYQGTENSIEEDFNAFIKDGDNYVIVGSMGTNGSTLYDSNTITILDKDLNIIKSKKIRVDSNVVVPGQGLYNIKMDTDGNYIVIGGHQIKSLLLRDGTAYTSGGAHTSSFILKLNKNLDILVSKVLAWNYTDQFMYLRGGFTIKSDGLYFDMETLRSNTLSGEQRIRGVFKTDKDLNFVSAKIYNTPEKFIPTPPYSNVDGYLFFNELLTDQFGSNTRPGVFKLNNDYTVSKIIRLQPGFAYREVIINDAELDSNKNLIVLLRITSIATGKIYSMILKLDTNLNLISSKIFNLSVGLHLSNIVIDENNNYYLLGKIGTGTLHVDGNTKAIAIKLDKDFNILNNITLGNGYWANFTNGILEKDILTIIGFFTYGNQLHEASIIQLNEYLSKNDASTTTFNMAISKLTDLTLTDFSIVVNIDSNPNFIDFTTLASGTTLGYNYKNITITTNVDLPLNQKIDFL